jgi:hypothetical protein
MKYINQMFRFCLPDNKCFVRGQSTVEKNPKGCNWCGNEYNEAIYCGLCGKNVEGEIRPGSLYKTISFV